jgi:hypothetical protein
VAGLNGDNLIVMTEMIAAIDLTAIVIEGIVLKEVIAMIEVIATVLIDLSEVIAMSEILPAVAAVEAAALHVVQSASLRIDCQRRKSEIAVPLPHLILLGIVSFLNFNFVFETYQLRLQLPFDVSF